MKRIFELTSLKLSGCSSTEMFCKLNCVFFSFFFTYTGGTEGQNVNKLKQHNKNQCRKSKVVLNTMSNNRLNNLFHKGLISVNKLRQLNNTQNKKLNTRKRTWSNIEHDIEQMQFDKSPE